MTKNKNKKKSVSLNNTTDNSSKVGLPGVDESAVGSPAVNRSGESSTEVQRNAESRCGLCQSPENSRMVACDECGQWYHFKCVNVNESVSERDWICTACGAAPAQVATESSTPIAKDNTGQQLQSDQAGTNKDLEKEIELLRCRLDLQMRSFHTILEKKDEEHRQNMRQQKHFFETEFAAREQFFERLVSHKQNQVQSNKQPVQVAERQQLDQGAVGYQSGQVSAGQQENRQPTNQPIRFQTLSPRRTGAIPKASSTVMGGDKSPLGMNTSDRQIEQQIKLLEEKHALERRHLEERIALLEAGGGARSNGDSTDLRNELSRSQLAARQAVARELPTFSGYPEEWPLFIATFESSTRMCGYSEEENMLRLQRSLKGKALEVVRCRLLHPSNLDGVIATLRTLFGRPEVVIHSLITKIREMPSPKTEKLSTLIDFGVSVQNMCATIQACGLDDYMCNVALLQELVDRLPATVKLNWAIHQQAIRRATLSDFGEWLGKLVEAACAVTIPAVNTVTRPERRGRKDDNFVNVHSDSSEQQSRESYNKTSSSKFAIKKCLVCGGSCCGLEACKQFQSMGISSRWLVLKEHKLCRKCLEKHFGACKIKSPCGRNGCSFMHNQLLHDDSRYKKAETPQVEGPSTPAAEPSTNQNCNTHLTAAGKILFRYVPVTVYGRGKKVDTFAFLDDGSSASFIEQSLLEELDLEGTPHPLCLNWTGGQQRDENESVKLSLMISGTHNRNRKYEIPKVHSVKSLSLPHQSVSMSELSTRYPYLRGLPIDSFESVSPKILIGIDNCRLGHALKSHEGKEDQPVAAKTRLGWLVYGPCTTKAVSSGDTGYTAYHSFHVCACSKEADYEMNQALKEYFSFDSLGIVKTEKPLISKNDERALQLLSSKTHLKEGRFESELLWRFDDVQLPDSKAMAMKRLTCLEKRMSRDKDLTETLCVKIKEYEAKGYIRKLSACEAKIKYPRTWYLPIFPVTNPNKPGKVRIVWDAAASVNGVTLNSFLLAGPDQLSSLLSVLYKFREYRFAVTGDIREMFHQVLVAKEDQHSLRFLWRDGDSNRDPDIYVMQVMPFGTSCSPSVAQFAKNLNASRFQEQFPRASECIIKEHYVDDMLASTESEEEAAQLALNVRFVHSQAGFEIRNWLSNSSKVLDLLNEDGTAEKSMDLCSEMATEKVLGMWWCTETDTFTYRLSPRHDPELISGRKVPTKREVLRTLMTIYDPLGLLANFLMYLKVLLQDIWRSGVGWDEEIPPELTERWRLWLRVLPKVETVSIPRCYRKLTSAEKSNVIQLHVFVDASKSGIAAVAYWRFQEGDNIECALAGAKTRVAPLKYLSIPRLELQAAVIGVRLASSITESHRMKPAEKYYWTDSRDVVCWLKSDHRRYNPFVASRVGEILESSDVAEWTWISTRTNVADEGTKWQRLPDFNPSCRWFRGPDFLWKEKSEWPINAEDPGRTTEELHPTVLHHTVREPCVGWERFSKWNRLLRTIAYVIRFSAIIRSRIKNQPSPEGPLTQEELQRAEFAIYRELQLESYAAEMAILNDPNVGPQGNRRLLDKSSPLYRLSPYVDEYGVLRIRGRISACQFVTEETKNPVIIPKRNYVTGLIIADSHQKYKHLNHQTVLSELQQKYYIPQLKAEFNRVRNNCQFCKIRRAEPQPPEMGNLPPARLSAYTRPFAYTGIDYFGPMQVIVGRRVEKRYGVLLTCMTVRAIHIEIAHSLTTDSCILALRNFIARRGQPNEMFSDRGTNFIGANRELKEALQQVNQDRVMEYFVKSDMKWTFNPPASPHFGGCWERLIQSVKKTLNQIQLPRLPTDETLRTTLMEVEMIINSRPLTHVPIDSEFATPLTPNHFLLGSSNGNKPPIAFNDHPVVLRNTWKMSQSYADEFWRRWVAEYLPTLTRRTRWFQPTKPIQMNDLVLVVDHNLPRNCWPKGRVVAIVQSKDGQVRRVTVQTANGILERPAVKVAVLDVGSTWSTPNLLQRRTGGECCNPASSDTP